MHLSEISFISTKPSEKIFKDLDVPQVPVQNIVELCIDWLELQSLAGRTFDLDEAKKELFEDDPRHKFGSQFLSSEETLEKQVVFFFTKYFKNGNPVTGKKFEGDFWSYATIFFDYSRSLDKTEQEEMLNDWYKTLGFRQADAAHSTPAEDQASQSQQEGGDETGNDPEELQDSSHVVAELNDEDVE
ncbi:hypothetical protein BDR26DRAFT_861053 [Obelidium mucronatum]|nr:hypothetical protein BDR26DRAFT_861053 [Obelidium mucronatum]